MSEPTLNPHVVVGSLAVRQGLRDFRYFVGRNAAFTRLSGCLNPQQAASAWLHGPRRQGKSSLAHRLAAMARDKGALPLYIDAGRVTPGRFDDLLQQVVEAAPPELRASGANIQERFSLLARASTERPILVIFDEFDHVAVDLRLDEQAFLRSLAETYQRFCYLFVTRLDPSLLVEEVTQVRSRLLGICALERLSALEKRDVRDLCRRVAKDLGQSSIEQWVEPIWDHVGGCAAAVMTLLHVLASEELEESLTTDRLHEVMQDRRKELEPLLAGLWADLKPGTRSTLLREQPPSEDELELQDARQDGYYSRMTGVIRPRWLLEVGRKLGEVPANQQPSSDAACWGRVERMHLLLSAINTHLQRRGYLQAFTHTDESLRYFPLLRVACSEEDFKTAVEHLYKVLHEGARSPKVPQGESAWRLPPRLKQALTESIGYRSLVELRNFYDHDPGRRAEPERPSRRYEAQGDFFERHCGERSPRTAEQWRKIRDGLVREVLAALEGMETLAQALERRTG
jgi:hypothetical protein